MSSFMKWCSVVLLWVFCLIFFIKLLNYNVYFGWFFAGSFIIAFSVGIGIHLTKTLHIKDHHHGSNHRRKGVSSDQSKSRR